MVGFIRRWMMAILLVLFAVQAQQTEIFDETVEIHGSGTTNPSKLYWMVMDLVMARAGRPVILTYRGIGSGAGRLEFLAKKNSFGSGDVPLTKTQYENRTEEVLHVPIGLGPVSVFFRLDTLDLDGKELKLEPCTVAKIFSRRITKWNHAEIVAENRFMTSYDENITVIRRQDTSCSTTGFTEYLNSLCQGEKGWGNLGAGGTIVWPEGTKGFEGSDNVAENVRLTNFSIGYMDAGHGIARLLPEVALKNKDGLFLTSEDADIGSTAEKAFEDERMPLSLTSDWSGFNLYNAAGPKAWPIVVVTYVYIRQNLTSSQVAGRWIKAFLDLLLSPELSGLMPSVAYVPLPGNWKGFVQSSLNTLVTFHPETFPVVFETALTTLDGGAGNAANVISAKRRSWAEFQRFQLDLERTAEEVRLSELEQIVQQSQLGQPGPSAADWERLNKMFTEAQSKVDLAYNVAVAGIVFGVCGFVLALLSVCGFKSGGRNRGDTFGSARGLGTTANGNTRKHDEQPIGDVAVV